MSEITSEWAVIHKEKSEPPKVKTKKVAKHFTVATAAVATAITTSSTKAAFAPLDPPELPGVESFVPI